MASPPAPSPFPQLSGCLSADSQASLCGGCASHPTQAFSPCPGSEGAVRPCSPLPLISPVPQLDLSHQTARRLHLSPLQPSSLEGSFIVFSASPPVPAEHPAEYPAEYLHHFHPNLCTLT